MSGAVLYTAMLAATTALGLAAPSVADRLTLRLSSWLPPTLAETAAETIVLGTSLAAIYTVLEVGERVRPFRTDWMTPDSPPAVEGAHLLLLSPAEGFLIESFSEAIARGSWSKLGRDLPRWRQSIPLPLRFCAAAFITEAGHYAHHRLAHEWAPLWKYHAIHHHPRRLSWRNAAVFHPVDMLPLMLFQELPARLVGVDRRSTLALRVLKGAHGQFQHSNIAAGWRPLGWVFSTNTQHRWHHARDIDRPVNYGAITSVFDRLFGTLHDPPDGFSTNGAVGTSPLTV